MITSQIMRKLSDEMKSEEKLPTDEDALSGEG